MHIYKELYRIASTYYPQEGGFCTVIGLAVATGITFGKARSIMYKDAGRRNRVGSSVRKLNAAIEAQGFEVVQRDKALYPATLKTIQRSSQMRKGTFLVYTKQHVTVIKDGVCEDWSNNEIRPTLYRVESVYEVIEG